MVKIPISVPVACTLDGSALTSRLGEWARLLERAGTTRSAVPGGVELRFTPDARGGLEALVEGERACCAWAEWTVTGDRDVVVLRAIAASEPGPEVLRQLFSVRAA